MRKTLKHRIAALIAALTILFTVTPANADLQGIDVSNWQCGIDTAGIQADFVVVGVTWGVGGFDNVCLSWGVNQDANRMIQQAAAAGKGVGMYHYAMGNDPVAEADFFVNNTSNYFGSVVPVLDWESDDNPQFGNWNWVRTWKNRVAERTGVTPLLYVSAAYSYGIPDDLRSTMGLWVAQYADMNATGYQTIPWNYGAHGEAMRQYSATGWVNGVGPLDLNVFRGDRNAWAAYANPSNTPAPAPSPSQPATPDLEDLASRTIRGDFGNGADRVAALGANYDAVMQIVNARLGGGGVDLNALAWATIRGDFGNGWDRINALGRNYDAVMSIVNQLLGA